MKNLTNINVIKGLLEKYGFTFSKGLGQNFLINPSVCPKIAEYGFAQKGYGIIEIGTGFGTLSAELAKGAANPFSDVSDSSVYYNAILWAVEKKITTGVTETTFVPNDTCTRAQAVTFLFRAK